MKPGARSRSRRRWALAAALAVFGLASGAHGESPADPGVAPPSAPSSAPTVVVGDDGLLDPAAMIYPLAHLPSVTGSFGTYRISHHHAGLDLVTGGDETIPVLAAKAGEVYRLKRGHGGYGRAVYIRHPDGSQTVYGHLSSFAEPLRSQILAREKRSGSYKLAFNLSKPILVERGQLLGTVGTAGTDLVHLHFELREKGVPVNPLTRGLPVPDTQPPRIARILAVPEGPDGQVDGTHDEVELTLPPAVDGVSTLAEPVHISGDVNLLVEAPDRIDGSERDLIPYRVTLRLADRIWHETVYDSATYADMRHTELDYDAGRQFAREGLFHRLYGKGPRVRQHRVVGRSLGRLKKGTHPAEIEVADAAGNVTKARFVLEVGPPVPPCPSEHKPVAAPAKGRGTVVTADVRRVWRNNLLVLPVPDLCASGTVRVEAKVDGKRVKARDLRLTRLGGVPAIALKVSAKVKGEVEIGWSPPPPTKAERKAGARQAPSQWVKLEPFSVAEHGDVARTVDGRAVNLRFDEKGLFWAYPSEVWALPPGAPAPEGLELASPRYAFGNPWVPGKGYHQVRLTRDPKARKWSQVSMYLQWGDRVIRAGGKEIDDQVGGGAVHFAHLYLARDIADPTIGDAVLEDHPGGRRLLVPLADAGSGLADVDLTMDGKPVEGIERQMSFGRLVWLPLEPPPPGPKVFEVTVRDRTGRTSTRSFNLTW